VPAPMEEVERIDAVMVYPQQRVGFVQKNPYTMDVDRGRNCYACRGFGHMAWHCRNRGVGNRVGEGRRLEYGQRGRIERNNGQIDNLKVEENLETLD